MKLTNKNKHKRDRYVKMHKDYEENHIYLINGKSHSELGYLSVTRFIDQFFEEFNPTEIIDKYYDKWQQARHPKYFGLSKEEIALSWKENAKEARDNGTVMHGVFEDYVNECEVDNSLEELPSFLKWYEKEVSEPFRTEYTVYGAEERIVGNIDFIYLDKNGEMCVVDYKRSDVPNSYSFGKMCTGINLPDTKKSKNTVQLNIYKYLLEKYYDIKINHIYNLYIKEDKCEFVEQKIIDMGELL